MQQFEVDTQACRGRQQRLIEAMRDLDVPLVILTQMESVQWLTGARFGPLFQPAAMLSQEGQATLIVPIKKGASPPAGFAADVVLPYEARWHSTLRNDQREASSAALVEKLEGQPMPRRIGVEFSTFGPHLAGPLATELLDIEPLVYYLRRRKEADELQLMKKAIAATAAMYGHARQAIEPGINELDLYAELYTVTVRELGEPPTYFGQDFRCNARGGPPRDRRAEAGELYILDLGAGFRGYFSDNARTFAVGGEPTDAQQRAWQQIVEVFPIVESAVRPGASCKQLFDRVQAVLDACLPWKFNHHLGHGVGLFPHEAPHLNPEWDDYFEAGDVFTVEPGLYHEQLRHGIRLEQNYLVTDDGVELLSDFPLEL